MADDGLIAAYLRELRYSVAALPDADDIVAEAEDHLLEAMERAGGEHRSRTETEAEAIARFGSAVLVARVCITEAKRGAAVPTTRTRQAGLAALLAPLLVIAGQWGNQSIDRGTGHGVAVALLVVAFPAFVIGLWGLRARHGGLGRLGAAALVVALATPILSLAVGRAAIFAFALLLSLAVVVFTVEMLRASVLPVVPLVLLAGGPFGVLTVAAAAAAVTVAGGDAADLPLILILSPVGITAAGFGWLGWHLWREPPADRPISDRGSLVTA